MSENIMKCNILSDKAVQLLSIFNNEIHKANDALSENNLSSSILKEENTVFKTQITWIIEKCQLDGKQLGKYIQSSNVEVNSLDIRNLWFRLYPKGINSFTQSLDFSVHFRHLTENLYIFCEVALIDHFKNIILKETFSDYEHNVKENVINFSNFCPRSKIEHYQRQGKLKEKLTVQFRIKLLSRVYTCVSGRFTYTVKMNPEINNLTAEILKNEKYSDIILLVERQKVKSHKFILASQSPCLHILFKIDHANVLELDISKYHLLQKFLKYVYTEKFRIFNFSDAVDYYIISCKFEILHLKDVCTAYLIACLTEKNISRVWDLSRTHKDEYLFNACVTFIKSHDIDVATFMKNFF